jgi:hypothetical protein
MDPESTLFDAGCDLLDAARRLVDAAGAADVARAVPATLGCIEASLADLSEACSKLRAADGDSAERDATLDELSRALRQAQLAGAAARAASGSRQGVW